MRLLERQSIVGALLAAAVVAAVALVHPTAAVGAERDAALQPLVNAETALLQLEQATAAVADVAGQAVAAAGAAATVAAGVAAGAAAQGAPCPSGCNAQGLCLAGHCACYQGFAGDDCGQRVCEHDCRGNGKCVDGVCQCTPGFAGVDCSFRGCKNGCNNNGYCDTNVGACICFPGFSGYDCAVLPAAVEQLLHAPIVHTKRCPADCTAHGLCDDGTCWCNDGYTGADCSQKVCPNQCSGMGVCDPTTGLCKCKRGRWGDDCSGKRCPRNCHGNGECTKLGVCVCKTGYYGRDCSERNCQNDCSGPAHGTCTWSPSTGPKCHCNDGFIGDDCSQLRCPHDCFGHGTCQPGGMCACDAGFFGLDCSPLNCPKSCGANGFCTVPPGKERGECLCKPGWSGETCEIQSVPCPKSCSGHGTCNPDTGVCTCEPGHRLPDCRPIRCRKNCSGHGTCHVNTTDNTATCTCDETRQGAYCQELNLEGARLELERRTAHNRHTVASQQPAAKECPGACHGNGQCDTTTGLCRCNPGHYGLDCSARNCPNSCSGHGVCLYPHPVTNTAHCRCDRGWKGDDCNTKTCLECGWEEARGRCNEQTLKCECVEGWTGNHCQRRACANGCSGHGRCRLKRTRKGKPLGTGESECRCDADWEGKDCSVPKACPNDCSGKGRCHGGRCLCDDGWHGADCTLPGPRGPRESHGPPRPQALRADGTPKTSCEPACAADHGRCLPFVNAQGQEDFACYCENGWIGPACAVRDGPQFPQGK